MKLGPRHTSAQEDQEERERASLQAGVYNPYWERQIFLGKLAQLRLQQWVAPFLMLISVLAGSGFGRLAEAGAWTWLTALSLAASGFGFLLGAPGRTIPVADDAESAEDHSLRLAWTNTLMTGFAGLALVIPPLTAGVTLRPILPSACLGALCLVVGGFSDLLRRIASGLMIFASPYFLVTFLWPVPVTRHSSGLAVAIIWTTICSSFLLYNTYAIPGVPHPTLTASRIALMALLMSGTGSEPSADLVGTISYSGWMLPAWLGSLFVLYLLEWLCGRGSMLPLALAPALIHLSGALQFPGMHHGPVNLHLATATVEVLLILMLFNSRWSAWIETEFGSINYRPTPVFVPHLKRGLDYPLESFALD